MKVTLDQLQRELTDKAQGEQKLKKRIGTLRRELTELRIGEKRLIVQYERLVKDWKNRYQAMMNNGWRIVFAKVSIWYNKLKGE